MLLGIELAQEKGIVAMLTPYEWVSRPSAKCLRELIARKGWSVSIYRFNEQVFDDVMTTAAFCIIDKATTDGSWKFFEIDREGKTTPKRQASGSRHGVLPYAKRGKRWTLRGLSPGTQKVFTLTEGERKHHGLTPDDVWPCVTSLMPVSKEITELNDETFKKFYRDAGEKCWLIRSSEKTLSPTLQRYLKSVPPEARATSTCTARKPWYRFKPFPVGQLLIASGFVDFGPKVLVNKIGAHHVGSVYGVFAAKKDRVRVRESLRAFNFERRVVKHSGHLKKIEVRQLNSVLADV
jgi:hypothetical protein